MPGTAEVILRRISRSSRLTSAPVISKKRCGQVSVKLFIGIVLRHSSAFCTKREATKYLMGRLWTLTALSASALSGR